MGGAQALIAPAGAQNPHALHVGHFAAIANLVSCCYFACSCASLRFWHPAPLASMALMLATVRCLRLRPWPNECGGVTCAIGACWKALPSFSHVDGLSNMRLARAPPTQHDMINHGSKAWRSPSHTSEALRKATSIARSPCHTMRGCTPAR
mgnify:CR=1 FL=1